MSEETNILKHIELIGARILEELQGIRTAIYELEYRKVKIDPCGGIENTEKSGPIISKNLNWLSLARSLNGSIEKEDNKNYNDIAEDDDNTAGSEEDIGDDDDETEAEDDYCDIDDLPEISWKKEIDEESEDEPRNEFFEAVIIAVIDVSDYDKEHDMSLINQKTIVPTLLAKYGKKWKSQYGVNEIDIIHKIKQAVKEIEKVQ